jgi:homoserine dehydrogenase
VSHKNSDRSAPLRIGLAGMGTVGGGVTRLLAENMDWLRQRTGREIRLVAAADRSEDKRSLAEALGARFLTDAGPLTSDSEVDVFIELIGGTGLAKKLIQEALANGKHVVTANKALLAEYGEEIFPLAAEKGLHLGFEASVAGGIPTLQTIKEGLMANRIHKVMGILNGTANFILTEMAGKGMLFTDALAMAQEKGYAEADPTLDIKGLDAAHKLILLIQLIFGQRYPCDTLPVWGVDLVTPLDLSFARELGYEIKLIAQAQMVEGRIEAGVFPCLIPQSNLLASVQGSFNAIRLEGNAGPVMLYGHGAGDLPTASAVLADVAQIAMCRAPNNLGFVEQPLPLAEVLDLEDAVSKHYLRLHVPDRAGVLRDVGGIMAKYDISLAQVVQKGEDAGHGVPIFFLTHEAKARQVHQAMRDIESIGLNVEPIMHYRIF